MEHHPSRDNDGDDSWGDLDEVPIKDLVQSESDEEPQPAAVDGVVKTSENNEEKKKKRVEKDEEEGWVSASSSDEKEDSREEQRDAAGEPMAGVEEDGPVGSRRAVAVMDQTSTLASELYRLEDQLATSDTVRMLRAEKTLLEKRLAEALRVSADQEKRLAELRSSQIEILQAMAVLKKNHRAFQVGLLEIVETLPPQRAAAELATLISGQIAQQRALDLAAETKYMQDDASCMISADHPVVKLMRLTRNVNPLEASFMLVRFFCRQEERMEGNIPLMALLLDVSLRFWEVTGDFQLYPLYSVMVTHFRARVQRVGESSQVLLFLLTNFCVLFYVNRIDFDASESTDVVVLRNLQSVLLGLQDKAEESLMTSISGPSPVKAGKLIVKTKRALWIELRKLIVLAYAFVVRNEGELVEKCVRSTLDHIRNEASGELKYDLSERCTPGMQEMIGYFDVLLKAMKEARSPRAIVIQVFGQLFSLINGHCCNALMLRRSYSTMYAAAAFRGDLRHLDSWTRGNLPSDALSWLNKRLQPLTEMVNVLFMNKSLLRRPEIRQELCSSLSLSQLCQLLSSYEPQRGEEPVSLSLIQSLMPVTARSHQADVASVLVDVAQLEPIDLSMLKENWLMNVSLQELRDSPLPGDIYELFILFREQAHAKVAAKNK